MGRIILRGGWVMSNRELIGEAKLYDPASGLFGSAGATVFTLCGLITRLAAALEAQEWQLIETAPRNGRNIQVWTEELNTPECVYWGSEYGLWLIPEDHWDFPYTITHWRPLPDPPQD